LPVPVASIYRGTVNAMLTFDFDVIVVGAGHAEVEVALARARTGLLNLNIDASGGMMGDCIDTSSIRAHENSLSVAYSPHRIANGERVNGVNLTSLPPWQPMFDSVKLTSANHRDGRKA